MKMRRLLLSTLVVCAACTGYRGISRDDLEDLSSVRVNIKVCQLGAMTAACGWRPQ